MIVQIFSEPTHLEYMQKLGSLFLMVHVCEAGFSNFAE